MRNILCKSAFLTCALLFIMCRGGNSYSKGIDSAAANSSAADTVAPLQRVIKDTITVAVCGDIMMGNKFKNNLPPNDGKNIFDDVKHLFHAADIACGNLEGTIASSGKPRKSLTSKFAFMFMMPPHYAHHLADAGFDYVGLANNHIYDFFDEAMTQTEQNLDKAGIGYSGAKDPKGQTQHKEYFIKEKEGIKYGFCAFGHEDYSLRTQDTATVRRIVEMLNRECDIVVVSFHGGDEGSRARHLPYGTEYFQGDDRGNLRFFTHFAIDCGADVIYGHGPHVVRAIELYNNRFIAYSLGNFCTCGMGVAGYTGYAPVITVRVNGKGEFIDGHIHSFIQQPMRGPKKDAKNIVVKEIAELTTADIKDSKLNIAPDGAITKR